MAPPPREITIVVGRTGSGKTRLVAEHLGPRHPRRITFDLTGETRELYPDAVQVIGVRAATRVLAKWWAARLERWHLCISCRVDDASAIVRMLCPLNDGKTPAVSKAWGGVCVEVFELDAFLPVSVTRGAEAWRTAFLRGRHVGLSLLCCTQYPALVDRVATSQAGLVVTFGIHEPRQVEWMRALAGSDFAERVRALPQYESLWVHQSPYVVEHRDPAYRVRRRWNGGGVDSRRGAR